MKVLLTGASGQLANALIDLKPSCLANSSLELITCSRLELDLADLDACMSAVYHYQPDWVLNAGAYTAVDKAEKESDLAHLINAGAPKALASALARIGGRMLQISTDFVFDGKQGFPYSAAQIPSPLSVYGMSKTAGEFAVQEILKDNAHVLRTSWVYGPYGKNFVLTMLRLHNQKDQISVVSDQVGCPTSTLSLAKACWRVIELRSQIENHSLSAILQWSDAGVASWYDFALAIGEIGQQLGLIKEKAQVVPIMTADFHSRALRPSYSILDCMLTRKQLGMSPDHWRISLHHVLTMINKTYTE